MNYYLEVFKKYAVFEGRSQRAEYWYFYLFNIIVTMGLAFVDFMMIWKTGIKFPLFSTLYPLATIVPGFSVSVRRLHDVGKSGWTLLALFIPLAGAIWILILSVTDSNPGDNEYGQNPKGGSAAPLSSDNTQAQTPQVNSTPQAPQNSQNDNEF